MRNVRMSACACACACAFVCEAFNCSWLNAIMPLTGVTDAHEGVVLDGEVVQPPLLVHASAAQRGTGERGKVVAKGREMKEVVATQTHTHTDTDTHRQTHSRVRKQT